jgi:histidinol-phosphate aminotransferase
MTDPTYSLYPVLAAIQNSRYKMVPLTDQWSLPGTFADDLNQENCKLTFLVNPHAPSGCLLPPEKISAIADSLVGLLIVDEAYIDFSTEKSTLSLLNETPNLVVLQTFSKAWGMAGLRVGMAFASEEIISILNKIKPPYNINTLSQKEALKALTRSSVTEDQIESIKKEREKLSVELKQLDNVVQVFPSEANFILVEFENSEALFNTLIEKGIIVRNRSKLVKGCIRITVGTPEENTLLLNTLKEMQR